MMMFRRFYIQYIIVCIALVVPFGVSAQVSNSFTLSQQIGYDSIPPTIPSPVTAVPVAYSQIDITWGASTDDTELTGYRLYRDGVHIATTSLTSYSDTGLTASTTYTYTVEAYDWLLNISTSSVAVATTTLQTPAVATTSPKVHNYGTLLQLRLFDLTIDAQETSAEIAWETNQYAQYSLRWGKESAYELGFVNNDLFKKNHKTSITDLEPGTTYMYELVAYNQQGEKFILSHDSFTTKKAPDVTAPLNVSDLSAFVEGESVRLVWNNPKDEDFLKVRIVRNNIFYPRDTSNGYIAYNGTAESFFDGGALHMYGVQYYTVFSYDTSGNVSSGAVIAVYKHVSGPQYDGGVADVHTHDADLSVSEGILAQYIDIDFLDVLVLQNEVQLHARDGVTVVDHALPVVLQIPYDLLPEHLKTIVVTVKNSQTHAVSYILRVNADKTAYQAVIPPPTLPGEYVLWFSIYDYKTQLLSSFQGELLSVETSVTQQLMGKIFNAGMSIPTGFISLFILLVGLLYILIVRRKKTDEDKTLGAGG